MDVYINIHKCCNVRYFLYMGKRVYNEARKTANARYIAEKTDMIAAHLPVGYKDKLNRIAELQGCSKAQALKNMIDQAYDVLCSATEKTQE